MPAIRGETAPAARAANESGGVARALDGEILDPEIVIRGSEARRIADEPIELTARDVTPSTAVPRLEAPAPRPSTALTLRAVDTAEVASRSIGQRVSDFFRGAVSRLRLAAPAGRAITHDGGETNSVVVAPEELLLETPVALEANVETTDPIIDETTGDSTCEEGFDLAEDGETCERVSCDEGHEVNEDKTGCNLICEEGLNPNEDQTHCVSNQGMFPQIMNPIRRGIRTLGGLW